MKTLYIHIGTPKTATTSLQHFCDENEKILEEQGYCYPIFPHKFKGVSITRNGSFLGWVSSSKKDKRNKLEEEKYFRQGMDMVLENFRKFDNVILSEEATWSAAFRRGKPYIWEQIRQEAEEHGYGVKIIVYLRRQDSLADSWWKQKVKVGRRIYSTSSWEEFVSDPSQLEFDYYGAIKKIEAVLGKENIIIRRFGKQYFKNGSIYEDFMEALGVRYDSRFVISEGKRNNSLFGNSHEIKRILNMLNMNKHDRLFFKRIVREISDNHTDLKGETMFSAEEARQFMEKYREGNRKLMQEYFGKDEDLFDMDFSKNKKWVLDHTEMEQDIISLIGRVTVQLRQENRELQTQIQDMKKELAECKKKLDAKPSGGRNPLRSVLSGLKVNCSPSSRQ